MKKISTLLVLLGTAMPLAVFSANPDMPAPTNSASKAGLDSLFSDAVVAKGKGVVAGRGRDDPGSTLFRGEEQERVARAALLKGASPLKVFELGKDLAAAQLGEQRRLDTRGSEDPAGDAIAGGDDALERHVLGHRHRVPAGRDAKRRGHVL